jgi:hypothetical protein
MSTDKPFDFTRYRTQRAGHVIEVNIGSHVVEIDLDEIFKAHPARMCVRTADGHYHLIPEEEPTTD